MFYIQLSSTAKVERWFESLEPMSMSRPESGFVSADPEEEEANEGLLSEGTGTRSLLLKLNSHKRKKLLRLKFGNVTTF